jgi:hypothetical protein
LIEAITARQRSQRVLETAERKMLTPAKDFPGRDRRDPESAEGEAGGARAEGSRARTRLSKATDSHFAALYALFDEAEAVAQEIDESFAEVSNGGVPYYAPEMKGIAFGAVLRVACHKNLRLVFGNWRELAGPLL